MEQAGAAGEGVRPLPIIVPMGTAGNNIPRFDGHNILLSDWVERVKSTARLYQVQRAHQVDLALQSLEGDAREAIMVLPPTKRNNLDVIIRRLEVLYGEVPAVADSKTKFYSRKQGEGESIQKYAITLQKLWRQVLTGEGRDLENTLEDDKTLREQFISGINNLILKRNLKDLVKNNAELEFEQILIEAIDRSQGNEKDCTYWSQPIQSTAVEAEKLNSKSHHSLEQAIKELGETVTVLRSEIANLRTSGYNRPVVRQREPREGQGPRNCWNCGQSGHIARYCVNRSEPNTERPEGPSRPLN